MYVIDGYNVLYQSDSDSREDLIAAIKALCRRFHKEAIVVFDGYAPDELSGAMVESRFVGDADAEIAKIIAENDNPTSLTVVTSDKELIYHARKKNIAVVSAEQFSHALSRVNESGGDTDEKPWESLTDEEAARQLAEFNYFKKDG